jgi:hypothetical protein
MFWNYVLLIVGIVVLVGGLFKLGQGQGGWSFANVKANAGLRAGETSPAAGSTPASAPVKKAPDWVGIAATVIGLIVALIGLFKD